MINDVQIIIFILHVIFKLYYNIIFYEKYYFKRDYI